MPRRNLKPRTSVRGTETPATESPTGLTINITLKDIYQALCPECREALLRTLAQKAQSDTLIGALRAQLEAPAEPS